MLMGTKGTTVLGLYNLGLQVLADCLIYVVLRISKESVRHLPCQISRCAFRLICVLGIFFAGSVFRY